MVLTSILWRLGSDIMCFALNGNCAQSVTQQHFADLLSSVSVFSSMPIGRQSEQI